MKEIENLKSEREIDVRYVEDREDITGILVCAGYV
jgi:hypothetical protein